MRIRSKPVLGWSDVASVALAALAGGAVLHALCVLPSQAAEERGSPSCYQSYPNIAGKVLLENDKVVVQRFSFRPGQWEGVHAHPPNQLFIHLKGGRWTTRAGNAYSSGWYETGSVGWYGPVSLDGDHESMSSGTAPIEHIWVTLKEGCS